MVDVCIDSRTAFCRFCGLLVESGDLCCDGCEAEIDNASCEEPICAKPALLSGKACDEAWTLE